MTVEKPKPKQLLRPITTGADSAMNQSQFLAITCNSLKAREKSRVQGAIALGFASHWLKNWRESFKPITKKKQSRNYFRQSFENCSIHWINRYPQGNSVGFGSTFPLDSGYPLNSIKRPLNNWGLAYKLLANF